MTGSLERSSETVGIAVLAAAQALTFEELGTAAFGGLARALDASLLVSCGGQQHGDLVAVLPEYERGFRDDDPNHVAKSRSTDKVLINSRHVERRVLRASSAYHHFFRRYDLEHVMTVRMWRPSGETVALFTRGRAQEDFTADDADLVGAALPAFEIAVERCARNARMHHDPSLLESMLERSSCRAQLALDAHGRVLYRSPRAAALLGRVGGDDRVLPEPLVHAARRLAAFTRAPTRDAPTFTLVLASELGPLEVELGVGTTGTGARFIHAEIHDSARETSSVGAVAAGHGLTPAEARVLELLATGISNAAIARKLHVSVSTVRTHVQRVFGKLDVTTRAQAALVARGLQNHPIG